MRGLREFIHFFKESAEEFLANKATYITGYLALVLLGNAESLWPSIGVEPESLTNVVLTVAVSLLTFVILAQIVLIQKRKHGGTGELSFVVPTFLLYNIYYSMMFFAALFIPAALIYFFIGLKLKILFWGAMSIGILFSFYVSTIYSMVALVAVCDDEVTNKFFLASRKLVSKNLGLVAWMTLISLILEFSVFGFSLISDPLLKSFSLFFYSLPDAFVSIVLTIASVKIFYRLKNS